MEAKADESSGKTVKAQLADAPIDRGSDIPERVARLSRGLIGREVDAQVELIRYQLFHALAATAVLCKEKHADLGVLIVHGVRFLDVLFSTNSVENANDSTSFIQLIPGWEHEALKTGNLLPPIKLHGSEERAQRRSRSRSARSVRSFRT